MPTPRVTPDNLVRIEHVVSLIGKRVRIQHRWFHSSRPITAYVKGYSLGPRGAVRVHVFTFGGRMFAPRTKTYAEYYWTVF